MTLGAKIRAARLSQRLTQEQLAGRDFTKSYISQLERGARAPRLITLRILARRLSRPLSHFLGGVPEEREAEAYLTIGTAYVHAEAFGDAQLSLEQALEVATQQGDEVLQARIELAMAELDRRLGRIPRAGRRVERSLRALTRLGDAALLARAQALRGRVKLDAGDAASALWAFEAGLGLAKHLPHPFLLADLYAYLGVAYRRLGRAQESQEAFRRALESAEPLRNLRRVGAWHLAAATGAARYGRFEEAAEEAGKALALYAALEHRRGLAEIHERLGEADLLVDRWEEAHEHYLWSATLHGATGNFAEAAQALGSLVEAMVERTSPEGVRAMGDVALTLLPNDGDPAQRAHVLRVRGSICRLLGRADEARAALEESLRLLEELRRTDDARLVRQELALLAIEAQDVAGARRHLKLLWDEASVPAGL
jgi:tetratricopeptide (TPR) repeat protein